MSLNPKITKENGVYWLNWTPDQTAEGYAFATPGGASRTFNPAQKRAKLGTNLVEPVVATVTPLDVSARTPEQATYPPPVIPQTPPPVWDGRATKMTLLPVDGASGVETAPPNVWPTGAYIHSDITLADDARWARVFHCRMKGGLGNPADWLHSPASKNPWGKDWQQADSYSLELETSGGVPYKRTIMPGEEDWYAQSFRLNVWDNHPNFGSLTQMGYPTLASPPFAFCADRNGLNVLCLPGMLVGGTTGWWDRHVIGPWEPVVGHWYDFCFGVKWDWDPKDAAHPGGAGWYECWTRCQDLGETVFTKRFGKTNCGTYQYKQGEAWQPIKDKNGIYAGTGTAQPESWTISCDLRGLTRHATRADAEASLA